MAARMRRWRVGLSALVAVGLLGCAPRVRVTTLEAPLEAGVPAPFFSERATRWDFGDGSASGEGAQVLHAFARAGRYEVRGFDGERLVERLTLEVEPRNVFHAIPPDVRRVTAVRTTAQLMAAVASAERLTRGGSDRLFGRAPAIAFAVHSLIGDGGRALDLTEGVARFAWSDGRWEATLVGVTDEARALAAMTRWLESTGLRPLAPSGGAHCFEDGALGLVAVFVDRGVLYAASSTSADDCGEPRARVARMDGRGLEVDPTFADLLDALPAGDLVFFERPPLGEAFTLAWVAAKLHPSRVTVSGGLRVGHPLWAPAADREGGLLSRAPSEAVAWAHASVAPATLLSALEPTAQAQARRALQGVFGPAGVDGEALLARLAGPVEVAVWADVPGLVRRLLGGGAPWGAVRLEAPLRDAPALNRPPVLLGRLEGADVTLALGPGPLTVGAGQPPDGPPEDLAAPLRERAPEALQPGHVAVFVDVGRLRRQLLEPRLMDDVSVRAGLMMQTAIASALDRLTRVSTLVVDARPDARGATFSAEVTFRPDDERPGAGAP